MARVTITMQPKDGSRVVNKLRRRMPKITLAGVVKAVGIIEGQTKRNLSGPSHTRYPGNGNPYPGTVTGRLKRSVHSKVRRGREVQGVVGPNVEYAPFLEFGTRHMSPYPFMWPSYEQVSSKVLDALDEAVQRGMR